METMIRIKDIKTALELFEESCIKQAEATEKGDYKTGNKSYNNIIKATNFLKHENAICSLEKYLSSPFVGVRLWTACYWLSVNEIEGIMILEEIANNSGIHALTAKTTLDEWKKGNLIF